MDTTELATLITAAGGLGTAAFGIVDAVKGNNRVGLAGFDRLEETLSKLVLAFKSAYGDDYLDLLRAQYRGGVEELGKSLRQGVRAGLTTKNAKEIALSLGVVDPQQLHDAVRLLENAEMSGFDIAQLDPASMTPEQRAQSDEIERAQRILARYEMAADLRIDAAVTVAYADYKRAARMLATEIAIALGLTAGVLLALNDCTHFVEYVLKGAFVGFAAVPLAPIAKDIATAIQTTASAMKRKG